MLKKMLAAPLLCLPLAFGSGCSQEEKVVDIKTPAGDVEVTRDTGDGEVNVEVDTDE